MSSKSKKGNKAPPRVDDSTGQSGSQLQANEPNERSDPQEPINPPSVQDQIANLASVMEEHSEALAALKDVPSILANLTSYLGPTEDEGANDNFMTTDEEEYEEDVNLLDQYRDTHESEHNVELRQEDAAMLDILNISQPSNEYGDPLGEAVAKSFERMISNRPTKEKIEKWKEDYKPPENCKSLSVPRVNVEIWPQLKNKSRNVDLGFQQQANHISQASVVISRMADKIFAAGKTIPKEIGEELLRLTMDAGSILGLASQDLSAKRKAELKPHLNREFSSICSSKNPTTEWLFGENVLDQLKASKNAANVIKPAFSFQPRNQRFQPYRPRQNLNFKKPPFQPKGGMLQNQRFRQAHQPHYPQQGSQFRRPQQ